MKWLLTLVLALLGLLIGYTGLSLPKKAAAHSQVKVEAFHIKSKGFKPPTFSDIHKLERFFRREFDRQKKKI